MPLSSAAGALMVPLALLPIGPPGAQGPAGPAGPTAPKAGPVVDARFDRADGFVPARAITHAPDLVPYGSQVRVTVGRAAGRTSVTVELAGVADRHEFPAHVHTGRCGSDPASSGPHYQQVAGADAADNEVRMTVRTGPDGTGSASATVPWEFRPGEAHSLVLHAGTPAGPHAAADRAACVDVDF
ncbi:superoxide dismutase family protein [Kitasatospora sp. NA04385]|uniref:superoxide dismutase family protein n=1 Tax=Kitasatospora sp. NA04385 TaxID=2742135 RepID=UPI001591DCA0|nr:superoxide dismutase family protein [Kitasatospora sp. NA04385]QKW19588.1 superoxide dismutase family protein [Kitasatospora sp. NA04385]